MIFMLLLNIVVKIPVNGVCWFLDELLYPAYHKVDIKEPVFFLTAPRSGSSQLCKYLESDKENFIIPTVGEALIPYIWYWRLFVPILARFGIKQQHSEISSAFGTEARKRHTFAFLKSGTWDALFGMWHLSVFSWYLGSSFSIWAYSYVKLEQPVDERLYNSHLLFTNRVTRKVLYLRGNPKQRLLLKIHFLLVAKTLKQQYPKAKFFTVVRQPLDRFQSFINFIRVLSTNGPHANIWSLLPPTWKVICSYVVSTQMPYCIQEMSFYKEDQENRLAIPFTMYVNDLSATLQCIYSFCGITIPDHVVSKAIELQNTTHDRTERRASYDPNFNKSLTSLGVDEGKVKEHLAEYIEWVDQLENCKKYN